MNRLIAANLALVGAVALHGADHVRQERGLDALSTGVMIGGPVVFMVTIVSLVLALRRHPRAAAIGGGIGAYIALGVTSAHFLPEWGPVSDPYAGLGLDWFSWVAAGTEVVAAAALACVGVGEVLARRRVAVT